MTTTARREPLPPPPGNLSHQAEAGQPAPSAAPSRGNQPLHMIRAEIDRMAFARWMRESDTDDPDTAAHQLIIQSFGTALAPRPHRIMDHRSSPFMPLLGYSSAEPGALRAMAQACQDPLMSHALNPDTIDGKPMVQNWPIGLELAFELRARPVTRLRHDPQRAAEPARSLILAGAARPGGEYDLHRWEVIKHRTLGTPVRPPEEVYALWLARMLAKTGAATLHGDRVRILGLKSNPARRHRGGQTVPGVDVIMGGGIIVQKPEMFNEMLARGIGRHIAYGHGMLLLRPPG